VKRAKAVHFVLLIDLGSGSAQKCFISRAKRAGDASSVMHEVCRSVTMYPPISDTAMSLKGNLYQILTATFWLDLM
jgi:hypothetical protein